MGDVALMPQCHILESRLNVGAHHSGQAGDLPERDWLLIEA
jgi:hypothetical protein